MPARPITKNASWQRAKHGLSADDELDVHQTGCQLEVHRVHKTGQIGDKMDFIGRHSGPCRPTYFVFLSCRLCSHAIII